MGLWLVKTSALSDNTGIISGFLPRKNGVFDEIFMKESLQERDFNSYAKSISSTIGKNFCMCLVASIFQGPVRSFAFFFLELLKINYLQSISQNINLWDDSIILYSNT